MVKNLRLTFVEPRKINIIFDVYFYTIDMNLYLHKGASEMRFARYCYRAQMQSGLHTDLNIKQK